MNHPADLRAVDRLPLLTCAIDDAADRHGKPTRCRRCAEREVIASIELTAISPSPDHSCVSPLSTTAPSNV